VPDHVDGHQHAHALPIVRHALMDALAARGWRGPIRDPADRPGRIVARGVSVPKALVIALLAGGFGRLARAHGHTVNDGFSGVYDFEPDADVAGLLRQFAASPGSAHLVMVHPGEREAADGWDPIAGARDNEALTLAKARPPFALRRHRETV
jgi:chitin disaccharide deacetylase